MSDAQQKRERCRAVKIDGTACTALATRGGYCIGHQSAITTEPAQWRIAGGHASSRHARASKLLPARLRPIADRLEQAFERTYAGTMEAERARALATLAGALVRVVQAGEHEERLRELEQQTADELAWRRREHGR